MASHATSHVKSMTYSGSQNRSQRQQERGSERRRRFTPRKRTSESEDDGTCDLCVQTIKIYAIGHCDHAICYRCSAKMRVLCEQNECAVCRVEMKKVIYCKTRRPFDEANALELLFHKRNNVWFTDEIVKKEYEKLFEHRCPVAPGHRVESSFEKLESHMRREHKLFYCNLCILHNTNFTDECKTYTREDLAKHRRVGDDDDMSHKGHPLCEFCDERYLDKDTLLQHLRKDHYFCHFCDQSGRNQYYDGYVDLRDHYRREHYLCEEGDCINEQFTSVFATELDLKAHRAAAHKQLLSRQQQKVERNIDLGFQYSNPPTRGGRGGGPGRGRGRGRGNSRNESSKGDEDFELAKALSLSEQENAKKESEKSKGNRPRIQRGEEQIKQPEPEEPQPPDLVNDFPTLGSSETDNQKYPFAYVSIHKKANKPEETPKVQEAQNPQRTAAFKIATAMGRSTGTISRDDFPTLGSNNKPGSSQPIGIWGSASSVGAPSKPAPAKVQKPVSVNMPQSKFSKVNVDWKNKEDFPTLGGARSSTPLGQATLWGPSASIPVTSTKKKKKAKTPIANQEPVKKRVQPPKTTAMTMYEAKPPPKSAPAVVSDNTPVTYDDTLSIRIGSHKHTVRLTSTKYSDQIADIEKPIEVPGVGGSSVKTVSADTFSLLSSTASSSNKQSNFSTQNYPSAMGDFPELGGGQGGRIRGIGPSQSSTPWGQSSNVTTAKSKKSKFSLSDLGKDIAADSKTPKTSKSSTKHEDSAPFRATENDFPQVTKAPPLSSYAATWQEEPSLSVADSVIKASSFQSQTGDFPDLSSSGPRSSQNSGKKNKKKKKNKGQPSASDISKHFGNVTIKDSEQNQGHLQNLLQSQKGQKSLSDMLDQNDMFAPVQNGAPETGDGIQNGVPATNSVIEEQPEEDEECLEPRPDEDDIQARNIWLITTIQQLCGNDENFSEFKSASGSFRQGSMSAQRYYEKCRILLGKTHFEEVFRELVELLPDSDKQEALVEVHRSC